MNGNPAVDPGVLNNGQGGAGDYFLRVAADGGGFGGKLTVFNRSQWLGDYIHGGVTAIAMDLRILSGPSLTMRLGFKEGAGFNASGFASADGIIVPNDGQWHHVVFDITEAALAEIGTTSAGYAGLMNGGVLGEVRILHSATPSLTGDNVSAVLGVDNITAIPAPGTAGAVMMLGVMATRRRRR